jgi:hypothetical protein
MEKDELNISVQAVDEKYYNFFVNMTLCFYAETHKFETDTVNNYRLFDKYEKVYKNKDYVVQIQAVLDALCQFNDEYGYFADFLQAHKQINYWERLRFYALARFFIQKGAVSEVNCVLFSQWMRVCRNLINNTPVGNPEDFTKAIRSIKDLSGHIDSLYEYLVKSGENIQFFSGRQKQEESLKASLMNGTLKDAIVAIENHPYFDGQIGFILHFAQDAGSYDEKRFMDYSQKLSTFFTDSKDPDCLFQRALLTFGDYTVRINNWAETFCVFNESLREKEDNWRKVFNDPAKSIFLKQLLDTIDGADIKQSLQNLIVKYQDNDWKELFIKNPAVLSYCSNYQIQKENGDIYLARSGAPYWRKKVELRSFAYYSEYLVNKTNVQPFQRTWYYDYSSDTPCAVLESWEYKEHKFALNIFYGNEGFYLFLCDRNKLSLSSDIAQKIKDAGFEETGEQYCLSSGETDLAQFDKWLRAKLRELNEANSTVS